MIESENVCVCDVFFFLNDCEEFISILKKFKLFYIVGFKIKLGCEYLVNYLLFVY